MLTIPLVAFGDEFVRRAGYCLASLKSPGNLPDVESHVIVYTDQPDVFREYSTNKVNRHKRTKHGVTSDCYMDALKHGHPIVPIAADMICPAGMLDAIENLAKTNNLVVAPVVRVDEAKMIPALPLRNGVISLSPRELCRLAFDKLHPRMVAGMFLENMPAKSQPTTIYRRQGETIVARCFHMHPLLLNVDRNMYKGGSIDGDLVSRIQQDEIHVVTDSDETCVFDMSDVAYNWETGWSEKIVDPLDWAKRKTNATHRWFFEHQCCIHAEDIQLPAPDQWLEQFRVDVRALNV